jgi:methylphosphotriester-DNA--protein-cysteine methyltransferase
MIAGDEPQVVDFSRFAAQASTPGSLANPCRRCRPQSHIPHAMLKVVTASLHESTRSEWLGRLNGLLSDPEHSFYVLEPKVNHL